MLEIFAGMAVLCATSKSAGLANSIAVDKIRKRSCRSSIFQLDLLKQRDREILEQWMVSPLLLWIHLAPVCGTASRARDIRRFANDPKPLRSNECPEGRPDLSETDKRRVGIANNLFQYACFLFLLASQMGILATMENPRNSYFWITCWVLQLMLQVEVYVADFQVCMLGGSRDKWTRIIANFPAVQSLNIKCDHSHTHLPWGFAKDDTGKQVWATSLESQYPRKMCVALINVVLQFAAERGLQLRAHSLLDDTNPLLTMQQAQIGAQQQPRPSRVLPIVPDFSSVAVFLVHTLADVPCSLLSKLPTDVHLHTKTGVLQVVPKYSRFLRFTALSAPLEGGESRGHTNFQYEVAFGLPWSYEEFIKKACHVGHPALKTSGFPDELLETVRVNVQWSEEQIARYRIDWCRRWMKRAAELEAKEQQSLLTRHPNVAALTAGKRTLLMREMLEDIGYKDCQVVDILTEGASLAGEIASSPIFASQFKPCLATLSQLEVDAGKRNEVIMNMTKSSGSEETDRQLLEETRLEVEKGWAEGPIPFESVAAGSVISRRFPLIQGSKTRMIDDYSISGVNDSCVINNKLDLHIIDTFCALVRSFFLGCGAIGKDCSLVAKTYDLKSAYRQVPVHPAHYKYAFVSVYNCERDCAEVYMMKTMPFGATHSVYNFLRLAKALHAIAATGLLLLTTNFYDDFVLASQPCLRESGKNSMEMLFLLTGWDYAVDGRKATEFGTICKALGVAFDFSASHQRILQVNNTESRKEELIQQITSALSSGVLDKQTCLALRGRLGFADSFIHGRLGKLVLKRLSDHAYGSTRRLDDDLRLALKAMAQRLRHAGPRLVTAEQCKQWYMYTDASFESEQSFGCLGGVLVDESGTVCSWFSAFVDCDMCKQLGAAEKGTIIYELELLATVVATDLWYEDSSTDLHVHFGDNDGVRFSLIRACGAGEVAQSLMGYYLQLETRKCFRTWFARVPTEANVSDFPSRRQAHYLLEPGLDASVNAVEKLQKILLEIRAGGLQHLKRGKPDVTTPSQKECEPADFL